MFMAYAVKRSSVTWRTRTRECRGDVTSRWRGRAPTRHRSSAGHRRRRATLPVTTARKDPFNDSGPSRVLRCLRLIARCHQPVPVT